MKKVIASIALAAICLGTFSVSAFVPVKMQQDSVKKMKMKSKSSKTKMKVKKTAAKDTTQH